MDSLSAQQVREEKKRLREEAQARRRSRPDKETASVQIFERVLAMPEFAAARSVLIYVHIRHEVRTRWLFGRLLQTGKKIVVPYCAAGRLELFHLESMEELTPGMMAIPEPRQELREVSGKTVLPADLDLLLIPGVAFDRRGGRLGHGAGYFDRLLKETRPDALKIGICFECQIFPEVPMVENDRFMDRVVTEARIYPGDNLR